jgi:hypothetical protein
MDDGKEIAGKLLKARRSEDVKKVAREIIAEIKKANPAAATNEAYVCFEIAVLKNSLGPLHRYRQPNQDYAKSVIKCVKELQRLLKGQPDVIDPLYFLAPITGGPEKGIPVLRLESLKELLADMREKAQWIIDNKIGEHGSYGHEQIVAADTAADLMIAHGLPLACRSDKSTYRYVAGLLYEAMSGLIDADIRRACETVAQRRDRHRNSKK